MGNGFHLFGYVKHCGCWKDKCGVPVYSLSCIFSFLSVPESTVCFSPLHWVISSILRNTFANQCSVSILENAHNYVSLEKFEGEGNHI